MQRHLRSVRNLLFPTALVLAGPLGMAPWLASCGNDAPPTAAPIRQRDSMAVMTTYGVSKLISDSGVVRYKVLAEEWRVFDKTKPPRQEFPKGIFLQRLNDNFRTDLFITADTAYCYDQNLWKLIGNVYIRDFANGTTFSTSLLYWNMSAHKFYSNHPIHVVTPDREIRGNWFEANESMTQYRVMQARGYMPFEGSGGAIVPSGPGGTPSGGTAGTATSDTIVRPREVPRPRSTTPSASSSPVQ